VLESAGKCWKVLESAGKCWKVLESAGKCWKVLEGRGSSQNDTPSREGASQGSEICSE